jgi:hypothetical protein
MIAAALDAISKPKPVLRVRPKSRIGRRKPAVHGKPNSYGFPSPRRERQFRSNTFPQYESFAHVLQTLLALTGQPAALRWGTTAAPWAFFTPAPYQQYEPNV